MASFWTRQRVEAARIRAIYPEQELWALLGYVLFYIALSGVTGKLIRHWPLPLMGSRDFLVSWWYFFGFKICFLLVIPVITWRWLGYGWEDLAPGGLTVRDAFWAVVAFVAGATALNSEYLPDVQHVIRTHAVDHAWLRVGVGGGIALFNAAIPEEFVFRYWLQTRLESRFGRVVAVEGTALLFTAWHIPSRYFLAYGGEGNAGDLHSVLLNTGVPVFIVGLILGLLWDRSRRLLPLVALHWGIDFLPIISSMLGILRRSRAAPL